jgi:hypothetical protein
VKSLELEQTRLQRENREWQAKYERESESARNLGQVLDEFQAGSFVRRRYQPYRDLHLVLQPRRRNARPVLVICRND